MLHDYNQMQCSRNSRLIEAPRFWATPAALNAAGFPVGRKPAVRGDGTQTTTQRTLKRKAKRHIRCEAKRASRRGAREAGSAVGADFLGDAAAAEQPAFLGPTHVTAPGAAASDALLPPRGPAARKFVYGNYDGYYGYRHADAATTEPRLRALRPEWFRGRRCVDIGCNSGLITAAIAETFGPRQIVGLDIDERLVARARALVVQQAAAARVVYDAPAQAAAAPAVAAPAIAAPATAESASHTGEWPMLSNAQLRDRFFTRQPGSGRTVATIHGEAVQFPANVAFVHCNFVQEPPLPGQPGTGSAVGTYDTALCLSTTKWVHLNWGDEGLMRLFRRVHACLRPGGVFVLEPQPWSSYRKRASITTETKRYFREIALRPENFVEFLLRDVGFSGCEQIDVPYAIEQSGWKRRPLLVLTK